MPFTMVHLYTASKLEIINRADNLPQLYLGVLAPDAYGHKKVKSSSDRDETHLFSSDTVKWENNAVNFIQKCLNDNEICFFIGYGIHLLTDICWDKLIYKPFMDKHSPDKSIADADTWETYRSDMTKIDIWLYRNCQNKDSIWEYIKQSISFNVKGLITAGEMDAEKAYTLPWYDERTTHAVDGFTYIQPEEVLDFIDETVSMINNYI